jgi:hypothetical protein
VFDYFFHFPESRTRFTRFLEARKIPYQSRDDALGRIVAIPEDLDDAIVDAVECCYESSLQEQESLSSTLDDETSGKTVTALSVQLTGGQTVYASIPAEFMRRLLSVLSPEEIGQIVDAIANAVENPDPRPLCQR